MNKESGYVYIQTRLLPHVNILRKNSLRKISHNIWKMYSPTRWIDSKEEKFYFVLIHQKVVNLHQKVRKSVLVIHKTELSSVFYEKRRDIMGMFLSSGIQKV